MNLLGSFMNLAGPDLIVILLIILVLFGAKKLPELARGMGQAVKEFQKAKDEFSNEAQLTVPQGESQPSNSAVRADPNQTVAPSDKGDQV
jgi:sec-independent protein translocase protein TatA